MAIIKQRSKESLIDRKILSYLIRKAINGRTTTYEEIALYHELPSTGNGLGAVLSPILGRIFMWCEAKKLPPLTALVVRKSGEDAGIPGRGFWDIYEDKLTIADLIEEGLSEKGAKRVVHSSLLRQIFSYYQIGE